MRRTKDYHESLIKRLKDHVEAAGYLNAVLEDGDEYLFLVALRNVAEAHGGMSSLSRLAKLNRANLYKMLSKKGRPEIQSLARVLDVLGLTLSVSVKPRRNSKLARAA